VILLVGGVALLGSFALIFLGDHYPRDILAGWLVAGGWLCASLSGLAFAKATRGPVRRNSASAPPPSPSEAGG
jgi:membrane-associated phospholipid phosphatase